MPVSDLVGILAIAALAVSLVIRVSSIGGRTQPSLFLVQALLVPTLILSFTCVYPVVDGWLGGHNVLNLIQHLLLCVVYFAFTRIVAAPLRIADRRLRALTSVWILVLSVVGTVGSYALIGGGRSSNGMTAESGTVGFGVYWCFSLLCLWGPALGMIPALLRALKRPAFRFLGPTYRFMIIGYGSSQLATIVYMARPWFPSLDAVKDLLVLLTELGLILALLVCPVITSKAGVDAAVKHREKNMGKIKQ